AYKVERGKILVAKGQICKEGIETLHQHGLVFRNIGQSDGGSVTDIMDAFYDNPITRKSGSSSSSLVHVVTQYPFKADIAVDILGEGQQQGVIQLLTVDIICVDSTVRILGRAFSKYVHALIGEGIEPYGILDVKPRCRIRTQGKIAVIAIHRAAGRTVFYRPIWVVQSPVIDIVTRDGMLEGIIGQFIPAGQEQQVAHHRTSTADGRRFLIRFDVV